VVLIVVNLSAAKTQGAKYTEDDGGAWRRICSETTVPRTVMRA